MSVSAAASAADLNATLSQYLQYLRSGMSSAAAAAPSSSSTSPSRAPFNASYAAGRSSAAAPIAAPAPVMAWTAPTSASVPVAAAPAGASSYPYGPFPSYPPAAAAPTAPAAAPPTAAAAPSGSTHGSGGGVSDAKVSADLAALHSQIEQLNARIAAQFPGVAPAINISHAGGSGGARGAAANNNTSTALIPADDDNSGDNEADAADASFELHDRSQASRMGGGGSRNGSPSKGILKSGRGNGHVPGLSDSVRKIKAAERSMMVLDETGTGPSVLQRTRKQLFTTQQQLQHREFECVRLGVETQRLGAAAAKVPKLQRAYDALRAEFDSLSVSFARSEQVREQQKQYITTLHAHADALSAQLQQRGIKPVAAPAPTAAAGSGATMSKPSRSVSGVTGKVKTRTALYPH